MSGAVPSTSGAVPNASGAEPNAPGAEPVAEAPPLKGPGALAEACANIAFVKYWGNRDHDLRLPWHGSLSMNLDGAVTRTRVAFETESDGGDRVWINGAEVSGAALDRVSRHLDVLRSRAGRTGAAVVVSENSFPMATGIASSASGFAALTVAAAAALGLELSEAELSALARRGSGSAARSVPAGFVEWHPGHAAHGHSPEDDETGRDAAGFDVTSHAVSVAPPDYWDLRDLVAVVSTEPKTVGSTSGHRAAEASPLFDCRKAAVPAALDGVRAAVLARDIEALGTLSEHEALSLHAVAMTGEPSLLYWAPATLEILHAVRSWRQAGLACFFTLDAGPNVHVICEGAFAEAVTRRLESIPAVQHVIENGPGPGARVIDNAPAPAP